MHALRYLLAIGALSLASCGRSEVSVGSGDLVTFRLPTGRTLQMEIVGEPFSGQNNPFEMDFDTKSESSILFSIEDVLCLDRNNNNSQESITIDDPRLFQRKGIRIMNQDQGGHVVYLVTSEPSTFGPGAQKGPEAERLSAQGCLPYSDRMAVVEISTANPVELHMATGGQRKVEIASPFRIVEIRRAREHNNSN